MPFVIEMSFSLVDKSAENSVSVAIDSFAYSDTPIASCELTGPCKVPARFLSRREEGQACQGRISIQYSRLLETAVHRSWNDRTLLAGSDIRPSLAVR
jgi:hypothetical protein